MVFGTLRDIAEKVKSKGIKKMGQILVGNFIEGAYEI